VKYGRQWGGVPWDTLIVPFRLSPTKIDAIGGPTGPVSIVSVRQPKRPS
jgi:hypothetical protein